MCLQLLNHSFKMLFKKKIPRKWDFGNKPFIKNYSSNTCKYDIETACKIILTQIINHPNVELYIYTNDSVVKKYDTKDIEMQAILQGYPEAHRYILHLRRNPSEKLISIICHEMIHLDQYERGDLQLNGTVFTWKGEQYKNAPNYLSRPWEIEAIEKMYKVQKELDELYYEK